MIYLKENADFSIEGSCAVTIGKFDGVHRGHQTLIRMIRQAAAEKKLKTVVFTFATSPRIYLAEESGVLMNSGEKAACLEEMGIDYLIEYPFTDEVRTMEPEEFVRKLLAEKLHTAFLAVGEDFCFGYRRRGNCRLLEELSEKFHFRLAICPKLKYNEKDISSSYIREEIRRGRMEEAAVMMGRPYRLEGEVEHGKALGRTIGFPTLNIVPDSSKVLPPNGVYFTTVHIDGREYRGVANIGVQPTVDIHRLLLEVHVLDYNRMIYGKWVYVDLYNFHRPEKRFSGIDALTDQLKADTADCIRYFEEMRG